MASTQNTDQAQSAIKVLSLGLPRTASASLTAAYRILGYNAQHGMDELENIRFHKAIADAAEATYPNVFSTGKTERVLTMAEWDAVWGSGVEVVTDWAAMYGEQLVKAYPDAKVVLCERNFEPWYRSYNDTLLSEIWGWTSSIMVHFVEPLTGLRLVSNCRHNLLGLFQAKDVNDLRAKSRDGFHTYYDTIKRVTPAERLLVYRIGEGWEPLCKFLDKPVPSVEFPHVNERIEMQRRIDDLFARSVSKALRKLGMYAATVAAVWISWKVMHR